ncbi:MAG TPA: heparinase II/III family protein, partial [Armatimonadota bacterium]|nr:heparinase II/III family protein [Armatimonadota bacterium]
FDRPYKIECPVGGEIYPSNDFGAYLATGMQDRSLLTGDHADDGWGWNDEGDPTNHWFVAYYAHWIMLNELMPAIEALSMATVLAELADDARADEYAHTCSVLLWRLAEHYPDYAYEQQSREAKEHNPNYTGKLTNMIWEVRTPGTCAPAYDAVKPYLADDTALQALAGASGEEIDERIRERILLEAARCIVSANGRIRGNYGAHQQALVQVAVTLADTARNPTSAEMIDWVLANPSPKVQSDLGVRDALENLVYRDGMPQESIAYNYGWVSSLATIAGALADSGVNLFDEPRFRRLLTWPFDVVVCGQFVPPLGDTGNMFARGDSLNASVARIALPHFPDPRIAEVVREHADAARDLFDEPISPGEPDADAEPAGVTSRHFPAYGLASMQSGSEANRTASVLYYGDYPQHRHNDQLNLLLFSHGNALLTDIGYPEQTDSRNHRRAAFFDNTVAHNTVVVDARKQGRGVPKLHAYEPNGFAQIVDASTVGVYGDAVTQYRRACIHVQASPTDSYVFDAFYVSGGDQHDYVALGPPSEFTCDPPLGPVQDDGTLAGVDVPYEHFYDDARFAAQPLGSMAYGGYGGSGFQYLFNVRRARLEGQAVCDWQIAEPGEGKTKYPWEGRGLRAHLLGEGDEIIACESKPQKYSYLPDTIQFMLRRRRGENIDSRFVTVYEPYKDEHCIDGVSPASVEPSDGQAVAARISLADGSTHYVYHSLDPNATHVVDGKLSITAQAACVVIGPDGAVARASMLNGRELSLGEFRMAGPGLRRTRIVSVSPGNGVVEVADPILDAALLPGQTVLVEPEGFADCLTLQRVIDATHFSIGSEDIVVAGGPVLDVPAGENRIATSVSAPHAQTGMTVVNSDGVALGRLAEGAALTVDRDVESELSMDDFPSEKPGSVPRFQIVMASPGDELLIPSLVTFGDDEVTAAGA